jgi:hypothetical protein
MHLQSQTRKVRGLNCSLYFYSYSGIAPLTEFSLILARLRLARTTRLFFQSDQNRGDKSVKQTVYFKILNKWGLANGKTRWACVCGITPTLPQW